MSNLEHCLFQGPEEAIKHLEARGAPAMASAAQPVFLLSAGWRSGSTLVQRLLNTSPDILCWGEGYEHTLQAQRMAQDLSLYAQSSWPPADWFIDPDEPLAAQLTERFVANLMPDPAALKAAHLYFYQRLYAEPAAAQGRARWGLKLVRSDAGTAAYFRWLYPQARIIFLHRHPVDAFHSFKRVTCAGGRPFHLYYPSVESASALDFARVWNRCAASFLASAARLGAMLLPYTDIGRLLPELREHVGSALDADLLAKRVDFDFYPTPSVTVTAEERQAIWHAAGLVAEQLGYRP